MIGLHFAAVPKHYLQNTLLEERTFFANQRGLIKEWCLVMVGDMFSRERGS